MTRTTPALLGEWTLRTWIPERNGSLSIHLRSLRSANGFRTQTDVTVLFLERKSQDNLVRRCFQRSFPGILVEDSSSAHFSTADSTVSVGRERWLGRFGTGSSEMKFELSISSRDFNSMVPSSLAAFFQIEDRAELSPGTSRVSGSLQIDGETLELSETPAVLTSFETRRPWKTRSLIVCPVLGLKGNAENSLAFAALRLQSHLWKLPVRSQFRFFEAENQKCETWKTRTPWDCFRSKFQPSASGIEFEFGSGTVLYRGKVSSRLKEQVGFSLESVDGRILYCVESDLADLELQVFRDQKLSETYFAPSAASFQFVSDKKSPYVAFLS